MNIVVNGSNIIIGGGLQVAFSILQELSRLKTNHKFLVFSSPQLEKEIININFPKNFSVKIINISPAKIISRSRVINRLNESTENFGADLVLSIFGPTYWKPNVFHICGFADGWCYNPKSIAFSRLDFLTKTKIKLLNIYKLHHLKKSVNKIFIETEYAKKKLLNILKFKDHDIVVISNTHSDIYNNHESFLLNSDKLESNKAEHRFLLLCANYPQKNIIILNKVIPVLLKSMINFKFIITISDFDFKKIISPSVRPYIINKGPVNAIECVRLYKESDFLFLPTLLETFTATYPEAMKMEKLILTSDLQFARDICEDAAIYFDPLDENDIVDKIKIAINDSELREKVINNGKKRLTHFLTAKERAEKLLSLCEQINVK
ncbi:MAG: hypothetical protein CMC86_05505 [Flavobacteriaceae bacterium]|nr:hypothetical protein [Flavobacteriaceae bacterium]|tara:strand:+ start:21380 stop:22513 length:1134 start_codon:yes stop_codon:yes gene_type:complete